LISPFISPRGQRSPVQLGYLCGVRGGKCLVGPFAARSSVCDSEPSRDGGCVAPYGAPYWDEV
jgi:hypothetical protein